MMDGAVDTGEGRVPVPETEGNDITGAEDELSREMEF
jgi:hypothetical protein